MRRRAVLMAAISALPLLLLGALVGGLPLLAEAPLAAATAGIIPIVARTAMNRDANASQPTVKAVALYAVALPVYGVDVASFRRDIADAQAAGIDGFGLSVSQWNANSTYRSSVANMFAASVVTGFKLYLSPDLGSSPAQGGLTSAEIVAMVKLYANHPNYYRVNSRPYLGTFAGAQNGLAYWQSVRSGLAAQNPWFVPTFVANLAKGASWYTAIKAQWDSWWGQVCDGLSVWAVGNTPAELALLNTDCARLMTEKGKYFMPAFSHAYYQCGTWLPSRLLIDYEGTRGLETQAGVLFSLNAPTVQALTWNDWTEGAISPALPSAMFTGYMAGYPQALDSFNPYVQCNAGYTKVVKFLLDALRGGALTTDSLSYMYRLHPVAAVATNDVANVAKYSMAGAPLTLDAVWLVPLLTAPAEVYDNGVLVGTAAAGYSLIQRPWTVGAHAFELRRNGAAIFHVDGPATTPTTDRYKYFLATG